MLQKITKIARGSILLFCIILSSKSYAQPTTVFADPALSSFDIQSTSHVSVNANTLTNSTHYYLDLTFQNNYFNAVPDHTAFISIGLGLNMILDPTYNLATAPYSNYITWLYQPPSSGNQAKIAGIIHTALPFLFSGIAEFKVITINGGTGPQFATGNFLVNNQNPNYTLVDVNNNNSANISYTVSSAGPLPVTLTKFAASKKDCIVSAIWSVENELNFSHYELQASSDGTNYTTINTVTAINAKDYSSAFDISTQPAQLRGGGTIFLRLKMVDKDATFKYSNIVPVNSSCDVKSEFVIYGYPNPVTDQNWMTIAARGGLFNGKYNVSIIDMAGRVLITKNVALSNVQSFRFDFGTMLTNGKYIITVQKQDGEQKGIIQMEKL